MSVRRAVGVDVGTSAVKVTVLDEDVGYIQGRSRPLAIYRPAHGRGEQNARDWWAAVNDTVHATMSQLPPRDPGDVAVGFTGQMHTHTWIDENDEAVAPAVLWFDTRATVQRAELLSKVSKIEDIIGGPLLVNATAPLLCWDMANNLDLPFERLTPMVTKDVIRFWATGQRHTDPSDASGTAMMDWRTKQWSPEVLNAVGLAEQRVNPIVASGTVIGEVRQLAMLNGAAAVVGMGDVPAQALSMSLNAHTVGVSLGTSAVAMTVGGHRSGAFPLLDDQWVGLDSIHGCSASIDWATEILGVSRIGFSSVAAGSPPGASGLIYLPFIECQRTTGRPVPGGLIGIAPHHTAEDIARAVLEGVAFEMRRLTDCLLGGTQATLVHLVGGLASDETWRRIFASVFQCPNVLRHDEPADGAAKLAATSAGSPDLVSVGLNASTRATTEVEPDSAMADAYEGAYRRYLDVVAQLSASPHQSSADIPTTP